MKKVFFGSIIVVGIAISAPSIAVSAPIAEQSLISITQYGSMYGSVNDSFYGNSTNSYYSNSFNSTADVQAYGSLTTGQVGSRVLGVENNSGFQSIASIFDTLTFNTGSSASQEVFFDLSYDGSLSSSNIYGHPRSMSTVRIFDITGLSSWLETDSILEWFATSANSDADANLVTWERLSFDLDGLLHDGTVYEFDETVSGSFIADPSKTYGIHISTSSVASNNSAADFLGTSTFGFTNLNGATLSSGSGVFLSQSPVSVPETPTLLLLSAGIMGLIGLRRKSGRKHSVPA